MIRTENYKDGLIRTYSDEGMMIKQDGTGILYSEAIDPADKGRTYTETDTPAHDITAAELLNIITGEGGAEA